MLMNVMMMPCVLTLKDRTHVHVKRDILVMDAHVQVRVVSKKKNCSFVHDQPPLFMKIKKNFFTVQKNNDPIFKIPEKAIFFSFRSFTF